jgi:hypothetical protein
MNMYLVELSNTADDLTLTFRVRVRVKYPDQYLSLCILHFIARNNNQHGMLIRVAIMY